MPKRKAEAVWNGDLKAGNGSMKFGSGAFEGAYSFASRFEEGTGTNPEELIGAAHAGCFSMALAGELAKAGYAPESIKTNASVSLDKTENGFSISTITLQTEATVSDIDDSTFQEHAESAKTNCPVSQALKGPEIKLQATLNSQ